MTLQQLQYAVTVASAGTITEAAERLYINTAESDNCNSGVGKGDESDNFYPFQQRRGSI